MNTIFNPSPIPEEHLTDWLENCMEYKCPGCEVCVPIFGYKEEPGQAQLGTINPHHHNAETVMAIEDISENVFIEHLEFLSSRKRPQDNFVLLQPTHYSFDIPAIHRAKPEGGTKRKYIAG